MPYNVIKNKQGKYKVRYKKGGKMHTIPGASESKEKAKKRIAAIEISKHMHENELVNEISLIGYPEPEEGPAIWWDDEHILVRPTKEGEPEADHAIEFYKSGEPEEPLVLFHKEGEGILDQVMVGDRLSEPDNVEGYTLDEVDMARQQAEQEVDGYGPPDMFNSGEEDRGINRGEFEESVSFEDLFKTIIG